ncbi:MAG TPA: hypothetical protein VMZ51_04760 [Acidimicrobiales bacterium]|nr:hypothetical protein [Acidimicrobiales bacterium]
MPPLSPAGAGPYQAGGRITLAGGPGERVAEGADEILGQARTDLADVQQAARPARY